MLLRCRMGRGGWGVEVWRAIRLDCHAMDDRICRGGIRGHAVLLIEARTLSCGQHGTGEEARRAREREKA